MATTLATGGIATSPQAMAQETAASESGQQQTATTATSSSDLMTPEVLWQMGRIGSVSLASDGTTLLYDVRYYNKEQNNSTTKIYATDINNGKCSEVKTDKSGCSSIAFMPDGKRFLGIVGGSLYLFSEGGAQSTKVADDVDDYLLSPNGKKIIIIRAVPTQTSIAKNDDDLPKASGMVINDLMYKHWDHYVTSIPHPFIGDFDGESVTNLVDMLANEPYECPMEPFGGVEQLAWSPDGKYVTYTCRKKTGTEYALSTDSDIFLYDVEQHKTVRNLCKPEGYKDLPMVPTRSLKNQYVNYQQGDLNLGYDLNPQFSPNGKYVAWLSMERDGYESDRQRLCVLELQSGKKYYTTEAFESGVDDFLWSPNNAALYFTGVWHGKTNIYRTDLSGTVQQLSDDQADYSLCAITPDGKRLIVKRRSMQHPDDIYTLSLQAPSHENEGEKIVQMPANAPKTAQLTDVNKAIFAQLAVGDVKERWVTTTDNKRMLCWVIYPPHFDPNKKYPALLFCEGGPQSPVSQFWSYRWNFQMMAANGYIIIAPNRRGLPGFGMEWLEQISGDYTGQCMQDYLSAIDDLCQEPYVNRDKLGAVGASFGGFSVYWLAGNHDKRFKAFIAHDGIYNTQQQYVETEEMWFPNWDMGGAPWLRNHEGQTEKAFAESPHLYVDKWDTPILCIHGQRDFRIEYTQAESAFTAARLKGIDAQLLLFPDENHWVLKPQNGILWQRTFFRWLDKYLK